MAIDVWMQHPTGRFLRADMLASPRRWTSESIPKGDIPIETTIASMDAGAVGLGLLSSWPGPGGAELIANDTAAGWLRLHPKRFAGSAAVGPDQSMVAVREAATTFCFLHGNAECVLGLAEGTISR